MVSGLKKRGGLPSVSAGRSEPGAGVAAAEDSGSIEELADNQSCTARGLLIAEVTRQKAKGHPVW